MDSPRVQSLESSWDRIRPYPVAPGVELGLRLIANIVRSRRILRGMSQRELAQRSGLHQSTISRLENCQLRTVRLRTLATILGVLEDSSLIDSRWS